MFDKMKYEELFELIDTEFQIVDLEEDNKLKFFEISEKKETMNTESFSLFLKSKNKNIMAQKIYNLKNEDQVEGTLFIVPIRQDEDGIVYESLFNRYLKN